MKAALSLVSVLLGLLFSGCSCTDTNSSTTATTADITSSTLPTESSADKTSSALHTKSSADITSSTLHTESSADITSSTLHTESSAGITSSTLHTESSAGITSSTLHTTSSTAALKCAFQNETDFDYVVCENADDVCFTAAPTNDLQNIYLRGCTHRQYQTDNQSCVSINETQFCYCNDSDMCNCKEDKSDGCIRNGPGELSIKQIDKNGSHITLYYTTSPNQDTFASFVTISGPQALGRYYCHYQYKIWELKSDIVHVPYVLGSSPEGCKKCSDEEICHYTEASEEALCANVRDITSLSAAQSFCEIHRRMEGIGEIGYLCTKNSVWSEKDSDFQEVKNVTLCETIFGPSKMFAYSQTAIAGGCGSKSSASKSLKVIVNNSTAVPLGALLSTRRHQTKKLLELKFDCDEGQEIDCRLSFSYSEIFPTTDSEDKNQKFICNRQMDVAELVLEKWFPQTEYPFKLNCTYRNQTVYFYLRVMTEDDTAVSLRVEPNEIERCNNIGKVNAAPLKLSCSTSTTQTANFLLKNITFDNPKEKIYTSYVLNSDSDTAETNRLKYVTVILEDLLPLEKYTCRATYQSSRIFSGVPLLLKYQNQQLLTYESAPKTKTFDETCFMPIKLKCKCTTYAGSCWDGECAFKQLQFDIDNTVKVAVCTIKWPTAEKNSDQIEKRCDIVNANYLFAELENEEPEKTAIYCQEDYCNENIERARKSNAKLCKENNNKEKAGCLYDGATKISAVAIFWCSTVAFVVMN